MGNCHWRQNGLFIILNSMIKQLNQDLAQYSELAQVKLRHILADGKSAKTTLIVSSCILLYCFYLIFSLYTSVGALQLPVSDNVAGTTVMPKNDFALIQKKHLFGITARPGATLADAIKSDLPIEIKGIISNVNPRVGTAILTGTDEEEKGYNIGDTIKVQGIEVSLEYIFDDKIYIKNNELLEFILYPRLSLDSKPSNSNDMEQPISGNDVNTEFLPKAQEESYDEEPKGTPINKESLNKLFNNNKRRKRNYNKN